MIWYFFVSNLLECIYWDVMISINICSYIEAIKNIKQFFGSDPRTKKYCIWWHMNFESAISFFATSLDADDNCCCRTFVTMQKGVDAKWSYNCCSKKWLPIYWAATDNIKIMAKDYRAHSLKYTSAYIG